MLNELRDFIEYDKLIELYQHHKLNVYDFSNISIKSRDNIFFDTSDKSPECENVE